MALELAIHGNRTKAIKTALVPPKTAAGSVAVLLARYVLSGSLTRKLTESAGTLIEVALASWRRELFSSHPN